MEDTLRRMGFDEVIIINRNSTYYAKDHVKDKPNMENCNTALYSTVFFDFMKDK